MKEETQTINIAFGFVEPLCRKFPVTAVAGIFIFSGHLNLFLRSVFYENSTKQSKIMTTKITVTALLTAVAIALQYIEVPIPLVPSFLKLDFSDLPELIGAFVLGPQYGIIICLLKNLIHLPVSSSMFVGEFSNFILGAIFVFVAGIIYQYNKTKKAL